MEDIECKQLNKENEDSDVEEIEEAPQQVNKPINKEQDAIARERFLRILLAMQNKQVQLNMYENTQVSATFEACDSAFEQIAVNKLITPIAVYENAVVRTSDLLSFMVDMDIKQWNLPDSSWNINIGEYGPYWNQPAGVFQDACVC